jgi:hypothetical protein
VGKSVFVPASSKPGAAIAVESDAPPEKSSSKRKVRLQKRPKGKVSRTRKLLNACADSFVIPFRGPGKWMLTCWTGIYALFLLLSIVAFAFTVMFFAILIPLLLIFLGHIAAYFLQVLRAAARGDKELPSINREQEVVRDLLCWIVCLLAGFGPLIFYYFYLRLNTAGIQYQPAVYWSCVAFGVFYTPMSLLTVTLMDTAAAVNPLTVLSAVWRIPMHYAVACVFMAAVIVVENLITNHMPSIPVITSTLNWFIGLYSGVVTMHLLGRVYYINRKRLGWFREE